MLETYCLVIVVALGSDFKFPTSKIYSPDFAEPHDDDDLRTGWWLQGRLYLKRGWEIGQPDLPNWTMMNGDLACG